MSAFYAFFKKEWAEAWATYRLLILTVLFSALALLGVFSAKFSPEIIGQLVSPEMAAAIPTPVLLDVWLQFFKNMSQIGLLAIVLIFSGLLTQEYQRGTLTILVTKGLGRGTILLAKFLFASLLFTAVYLLNAGLTYGYSLLYFEAEPVPHLIPALLFVWLFGLLLILISLCGGALFRQTSSVLLFLAALIGLAFLVNLSANAAKYNPLKLLLDLSQLISEQSTLASFYPPLAVLGGLALLLIVVTQRAFFRQDL